MVFNEPSSYAIGFNERHFSFEPSSSTIRPLFDLMRIDPVGVGDALMLLFTDLLADAHNSHVKLLLQPHSTYHAAIVATSLVPLNDADHPDRLTAMRGVTESCMSCSTSTPLWVGLNRANPPSDPELARLTSADCIVASTEHTNVWVDAKGRKVLIVTPKRHVERVSLLTADEWRDLLQTLVRFAEHASVAIVNHGSMQNHAHLHFKLFFNRRRDMPAECVERVDLCAKLYRSLKNRRRAYDGHGGRAQQQQNNNDDDDDEEE
jgi:diadenosine tetraphosphate (Ap4A) HIT family hydrolase